MAAVREALPPSSSPSIDVRREVREARRSRGLPPLPLFSLPLPPSSASSSGCRPSSGRSRSARSGRRCEGREADTAEVEAEAEVEVCKAEVEADILSPSSPVLPPPDVVADMGSSLLFSPLNLVEADRDDDTRLSPPSLLAALFPPSPLPSFPPTSAGSSGADALCLASPFCLSLDRGVMGRTGERARWSSIPSPPSSGMAVRERRC
mmetsp:Transcript_20148/g.51426  ORF Transcript_20148/g.51426 Transcript_20148/m.51426 type:complete len:207 (+) Transcript_20148:356-976(+)